MDRFRVGLSGDFFGQDGTLAFPSMDLEPLCADPRIELTVVEERTKHDYADAAVLRPDVLAGFDAFIMFSHRFTRVSAAAGSRLALLARFGVGYDTVDVGACTSADIALTITPDAVRRPVAASLLMLILAVTSKLLIKDRIVRAGPAHWLDQNDHIGVALTGRTLGLIGLGRIGSETVRLIKPLDVKVIACDPYVKPEAAVSLGVRLVDLETVFREADVLGICCMLTEETRHLVNAERLALMKPTAFLVNVARGPIVDQDALVEALRAKRLAGAALDVLEREPPAADEPIFELDNVILSPHALSTTDECMAGCFAEDVAAVLDVMHGRVPKAVVNRDVIERPGWRRKLAAYGERFGA
jgi:phosphoglycerate dehydrogenase-like enzyme